MWPGPNANLGAVLDAAGGITAWLESGHLDAVVLEIYHPITNELVGRFDFTIVRGYGSDDDGGFWLDAEEVGFVIRKAGLDASDCRYAILCDCSDGRPDVEEWITTPFRSTEGFTRHAVGTGIGAGTIGVALAYYMKKT